MNFQSGGAPANEHKRSESDDHERAGLNRPIPPYGYWETMMNFIESCLGVSPDGGNGSLEVLYLLTLAVVVSAVAFRSHIPGLIRRLRAAGTTRSPRV